MNVINPKLEEVDGAMYRINVTDCFYTGINVEALSCIEYVDEDDDNVECVREIISDDDDGDIINIEMLDNGRCRSYLHVPKIFHSIIIGYKGGTLQRLEYETKSTIYVPRKDDIGDIIITGSKKDRILAAYRRIQALINTARAKQQFTHFISIPMNSDEFQNKYKSFMRNVLETCGNDHGICIDLFQLTSKLHITIGVLKLVDDKERKSAIDILEKCKEFIIDPVVNKKPIIVHVRGVESMNDDPPETSVLYGKIQKSETCDILQQLVDKIANFFIKKGIMEEERDTIKLHVTLMNSKFLNVKNNSNSELKIDRFSSKITFDATNILQCFKDFDFGKTEIRSVHLSQRFTTTARDGYYTSSNKIDLY